MLCLLLLPFFVSPAASDCIPPDQAEKKVGATTCVTGKVVKISEGNRGVQFIDFCPDHRSCPFSAVIFADKLRDVGDIRMLPGKTIEVHGRIKLYDGHAEIIVNEASQLRGEGTNLPPVPKAYDVEQRGHYSSSVPSSSKPAKAKKPKPQLPPGGVEVPTDQQ